jgi:hypothetical protein
MGFGADCVCGTLTWCEGANVEMSLWATRVQEEAVVGVYTFGDAVSKPGFWL